MSAYELGDLPAQPMANFAMAMLLLCTFDNAADLANIASLAVLLAPIAFIAAADAGYRLHGRSASGYRRKSSPRVRFRLLRLRAA